MKLTTQQATDLLRQLGVADAEIDDTSTEEIKLDDILGAIDTAREPIYKTKFFDKNKAEVETATSGKIHNTLRGIVKKLTGLTESDVKDLTIDQLIQKAVDKVKEGTNQSAEEIRTAMVNSIAEWEAKYNKLAEEKDKEILNIKDEVEQQEIDKLILKSLNKAPLPAGTDKVKLAGVLKNLVRSKADIVRKDDSLGLFKPGNKEAPYLVGNNIPTFDDVAKEELTTLGLWQTDTRNVPRQDQGGNGGQQQQQKGVYSNDGGFGNVMDQIAAL